MINKLLYYIFAFLVVNLNAQSTCSISNLNLGSIKTHSGSQIGIFGDLNNNGSFTENGGVVGFYNQNVSQTISGNTTPEFSELIVDVPNDLNIEVATNVNLGLRFNGGRIITPRNQPNVSFNLNDTDIYENENDDRHVDGYTSYTGSKAYTFPVGDEFRLRTLSVEANTSINTNKAAYFFENPEFPFTFDGFELTETDETIEVVSPYEFWDLDGDMATRVTLTWDIMSNIDNFITNSNFEELRVVGWSISKNMWEDLGNTSQDGANPGSSIESGSVTSALFVPSNYEVITFGGLNQGVLPVETEDLTVMNAVSADGNDDNPYFRIKGINEYPNNNLKIYNRWGVVVFEMDGYTEPMTELGDELDENKVFMGKSNGRITVNTEKQLPTGTYFYILNYELNGFGEKSKAGYLYLQN